MNKVQTKRLLNVARALREAHAAKKKFDMEKYVFGDEAAIESKWTGGCGYSYCNAEEDFCGTPACALGHYAARTDLQRILKVSILKNYDGVKYATMDFFGEKAGSGWDEGKVCDHFGINSNEFFQLFDYDGCGGVKNALSAAKYIEKFVKSKQPPNAARRTFRR